MRVGDTVLASAFIFATATAAFGQNPGQKPDAGISKILDIAQSGNAAAKTKYVVDGLAVGSALKADSAAYREYKCSASEQFDGLTWCQKTRTDRARRGPFTATFSLLHARDGSVIYVNRRQEPSFLDRNKAEKDIKEFSRKLGSEARVTRMPRRGDGDSVIALWGETTLEPLDAESVKVLAEGKSPKKGLLIDFIGNFARSAKEGLPIYRIGGGAGFVRPPVSSRPDAARCALRRSMHRRCLRLRVLAFAGAGAFARSGGGRTGGVLAAGATRTTSRKRASPRTNKQSRRSRPS